MDHPSILSDVWKISVENTPLTLEDVEIIRLRILIDNSVVVVYVNEKQYATVRVYLGLEDGKGVFICSGRGESELISLDFWQVKNIWDLT